MRAPNTSFRGELAAYHAWLVAQPTAVCQLYLDILDRWSNHAAVETIWDTVNNAIPAADMIPASDFISLVIDRRQLADRLNSVVKEAPAIEAKASAQAVRNIKDKRHGEAAVKMA